jgi:hypothetical protein
MKIHWIRAFVAALLTEAVLVVITIPILRVVSMEAFVPFVGPVCFIVAFPFGMWAVKKAESGFVLHGVLVGAIATVIYLGLVLQQLGSLAPAIAVYGSILFFLANALKILGCVTGAYAMGRRKIRVMKMGFAE